MRQLITIIIITVVAFFYSCKDRAEKRTCEKSRKQELVKSTSIDERLLLIRAARFNEKLEHFSEDAEEEINILASFIDPKEDTVFIAYNYYHHWHDNYEIYEDLVSNITNVEVISENTAHVTIRELWELDHSHPLEWISKTEWVKHSGIWYRTSKPSELYFEGKLVQREKEESKYHLYLENY